MMASYQSVEFSLGIQFLTKMSFTIVFGTTDFVAERKHLDEVLYYCHVSKPLNQQKYIKENANIAFLFTLTKYSVELLQPLKRTSIFCQYCCIWLLTISSD